MRGRSGFGSIIWLQWGKLIIADDPKKPNSMFVYADNQKGDDKTVKVKLQII